MPARIAPALAGAMAWLGVLCGAPAEAAELGFNRVNLGWKKPAERQNVIDQMRQSGVASVRLSLSAPVDPSLDAVRIAHEAGLRILLEISLNNPDFYPKGTKRRPAKGQSHDAYRLSDLDPERYRIVMRDALAKLDQMGVTVVAVEPGNEINWAGYNGDLTVRPGKASGAITPGDPAKVAQGLDRYVEIIRVTHEELRASKLNRDAKLISAGLSDMPVPFSRRVGLEIMPAADWTARMRERGLDTLVDAYGIHVYPGSTGTKKRRDTLVREALAFCGTAQSGKPCWITEWGVANTSPTCPIADDKRAALVDQVRAIIDEDIEAGRVEAAYYFDWDSKTPYSVWRCGGLSSAGRAAVRPVAD
ncbi:glycoside hydrolase [Kaistia terrae]|uniref:Glycoside hydrolase n=1 Tax=Kaistia terrae TaxID=537017 RepID=A0ABW0PSJ4_9HYPH|nr:glycoside hydrolase [Kaistia terrae]MCX5577468.1 glycoside hydrolase [Kaistia terrae]